ncbi:MAG: cyclic pyranopterin phosphate synthase MoaA [Candidatus Muproteobacteria bacterium RBG_16_64_10]|uniref:GTP 3',8-cyclase n=1 Tax=Candidatus Muproteobacteria bacterium RBG_16_64_10 TaxID=1817757 RepID=A0A1F6SXT9_9PROT|nr:MAG: cyclic pyranopterin phosphate synthase MoaA [Candidatus Muproteobacteria bacterium RBG_16_64_10]
METSLTDSFGRHIEYVRLSVTDRCDLRCHYCLPENYRNFQEPAEWLTFGEIERVLRVFAELGVRRVRLTGGEPLTRRGLPELAARLSRLPGIEDLSLSTNAVQLKKFSGALYRAGVRRLNISLDSLRSDRFAAITGGGHLDKVLDGLMTARTAGFTPIKLNMVVMKGVNDDEIEDMVRFCLEHGFTLRLIETMPMGDTGRAAAEHYLDLQEVRQRLADTFELVPAVMPGGGPARYVQIAGTSLKIGFITPLSQHFCETCNRVRLAADGTLYLCLGQDDRLELRPLLRAGISDGKLKTAIRAAVAHKPERHEFREQPGKIVRFMARTGG